MAAGPVAGAVLVGGASRRMGRDKATLRIGGETLARRTAAVVGAAGCDPVCLVGGSDVRHGHLGLPRVPDPHPGEGPLGAIVAALAWSPTPAVLVVACDLPGLTAEAVAAVAGAAVGDVDAAVARSSRGPEWMVAAWRRSATGPLAERFAGGTRAVHEAARGLRIVAVPVADDAVRNANRPADLGPLVPARGVGATLVPRMSDGPPVPEIDVAELARRRRDGAVLVDVREADEWDEARVPGGVHIPLGELPERLGDVPDGGTVHVICRSGGRSARAVELLRAEGVDAVNVAGGTLAWIEAGHEVESGT